MQKLLAILSSRNYKTPIPYFPTPHTPFQLSTLFTAARIDIVELLLKTPLFTSPPSSAVLRLSTLIFTSPFPSLTFGVVGLLTNPPLSSSSLNPVGRLGNAPICAVDVLPQLAVRQIQSNFEEDEGGGNGYGGGDGVWAVVVGEIEVMVMVMVGPVDILGKV
ncbi:predicted protein [Pyrenophora tritici-repentis Pt-1C-BFP]|uniref:Uncharacterized protein n=1 Tax=Pyrenophora tritici-repentis (strain Pt-1C-BFP) TaxID=426418 RepID=B2WK45_PYRTR|nr:uncharacterized protein PTRG_10234 [Pyrenophora tritici-repentis Pt-1C-BFP]EDU43285.1 predicted protein [Pyrenophora tritici-repentis Pt-1C-BFP]